MNDYVPMTETVREAYRFWIEAKNNARYGNSGREPVSRTEATAEFERWLASVQAEAWEEGNDTGWDDANEHWRGYDGRPTPNPYREESS